jgi:hypothetical protein
MELKSYGDGPQQIWGSRSADRRRPFLSPRCYTGREKNGVFWVVTPCGSCKNRRFGGTWRLLHQGDKEIFFLRSVRRLLVAACVVPSSPIFVTLMKEAPGASETSVLTRATTFFWITKYSVRRGNRMIVL